MTAEQQARAFWYNRMMNVTARGFRPQAAGSRNPNPWKWTAVDPCSEKIIAALNSDSVPYLAFHPSPYAPSPHKGFWTLDHFMVDNQIIEI